MPTSVPAVTAWYSSEGGKWANSARVSGCGSMAIRRRASRALDSSGGGKGGSWLRFSLLIGKVATSWEDLLEGGCFCDVFEEWGFLQSAYENRFLIQSSVPGVGIS